MQTRLKLALVLALVVPACVHAQQPQLLNGQLAASTAGSIGGELDLLKRENGPVWLAYAVPSKRDVNNWGDDRIVSLEGSRDSRDDAAQPTDPNREALLLIRVANHAIDKIRVENPRRKIDATGTRVVWLANAALPESIALLQSLAESASAHQLRDTALFAISIHRSPAALPALIAIASPKHDVHLREKAAFWIASAFQEEALPVLDKWLREDADDAFREKLTFDLSLVHSTAAADTLVRTARSDSSPRVRKQAQFWMASLGGKRIAGDLQEAASNDPNEDVRKSAVFGLSRLPNGEGTTRLIDLAQTSKDPVVRKQAVFWLGQSNDPRALDYLTRLIKQ